MSDMYLEGHLIYILHKLSIYAYCNQKTCYSIFYQYSPSGPSICPFLVHILPHIADGTEPTGSIWCYGAFAVELFCGMVNKHIKN